jgi:hypothetical protein
MNSDDIIDVADLDCIYLSYDEPQKEDEALLPVTFEQPKNIPASPILGTRYPLHHGQLSPATASGKSSLERHLAQ